MIGSLMYVTSSRSDIMFAVCACSRFQVTPKTSHLHDVKRIFRYLKVKPKLGLWYPRESSFDLEAYSDSDYAGANLDRKSTTGGCKFLGRRLISWQCKKQTIVATSTTEAEYVVDANCCGSIFYALTVSPNVSTSLIEQFWNSAVSQTVNNVSQIKAIVSGQTILISESSIRRDLLFNDDNGIDCLTVADIYENLPLMGYEGDLTTLTSRKTLEGTGGGEGDQVQLPYDSPLSGGHTSDRAEGGLNLEELFVLCTNLSNRVLALETSKDAQATEILKLKTRIKKLEKKCKPSISHHRAWLRRLTLVDNAFDNLDADGMDYMDIEEAVNEGRQSKEIEELNVTHDIEVLEKRGSNEEQVNAAGNIGVSTVVPEVSTINISTASRQEVNTATQMIPPTTTSVFDNEDITLAETLVKIKDDKAKLKGVAIKEVEESDRPARSVLALKPLPKIDPKDKGKCVFEEDPEPAKKLKKSDLDATQLAMDEEFETTTPEGVDLVLWGDLRTMFDANAKDELWQIQERWNLKSWDFYENCRVHTLILEEGTEIHMLAERKYPLTKETLEKMKSLKLVVESASDGAYNLLRSIQKQIDESGSYDESEKDL
ncbi:hypothetical protein Tco_1507133 [Tanacetum coccineum]